MSFVNKVVLVTGSSAGIGAAIAVKFAEEGANVVIVGRNEKRLKDVVDRVVKAGGIPLAIAADICKEAEARRVIDETIQKFGKLDVLINNAGIIGKAKIYDDHAMQIFNEIMNVNVRSLVYLTHIASKHLVKSKGNIINVSAVAAVVTSSSSGFAYSTSKAAVDHFTRSIAADLAAKGVRANIINPGPVRTDILETMGSSAEQSDAAWETYRGATGLKRISAPEEIGDLALFLAGDKAAAITGASFVTDNGYIVNSVQESTNRA